MSSVSLTRVRGKSAAGQAQPLTSDLRDVTCKQNGRPNNIVKRILNINFEFLKICLCFER